MKPFSVFLSLAFSLVAAARADNLTLENVTIAPRDAKTAIVKFDISWTNAWRWGDFHDAAWVFFKVRPTDAGAWQHARLIADQPVNPAGFSTGEGTPLTAVVPSDRLGAFVRLAQDGNGRVAAKGVTLLCDALPLLNTEHRTLNTDIHGCAIEMVYVNEGAFYLGSGGDELNRFYQWTDGEQNSKPYRVASAGAIPTGRQKDKLWASGIVPEDGGEIPAAFPNGYRAFYAMKFSHITLGQYASFLSTIAEADARRLSYPGFFGELIAGTGTPPDPIYATATPHQPCPWLGWLDGATFAAWAGLRPMTELEYEKAIRGADAPLLNEVNPSYWGLADANMGNLERLVSASHAQGRKFTGTHGQGTTSLPGDWPTEMNSFLFRGKLPERRYPTITHLLTSGRVLALDMQMIRNPICGWRAARTAPAESAIQVTKLFDPGIVHRVTSVTQPPRLDGAPDGWGEPVAVMNTPASMFPVYFRFVPYDFYGIKPPWQGPQDLSATVYMAADKEALHIAATVSDDRHINTQNYDGIPAGDAIQIGLVNAQGIHWNAALALTTNGVAFHQYAGAGNALIETVECAVTRNEAGIMRYGMRLPLASIGLKTGDEFAFNILILDSDDGKSVRYWLRPGPGIEYPWRTALYPRFVLAK
ncbi:MAG: hypothetical protein FJ225_09910 [Lentisphaerae bacterium]|nr:hypothetical protein [Lentisphaerota bacterium]